MIVAAARNAYLSGTAENPMTASLALEHFQSLWAMEDLPFGSDVTWTLAEQVMMLAENNFDGVAIDLGAKQKPAAADIAPLLREHHLRTAVFAFVSNEDALDITLRYAHDVDADRMVVCAQIFDLDPAPAAATLNRWYARAAAEGIDLELETHRGTITNDLRFTSSLVDHLDPQLSLAIDLSHFVCANEFPDLPDPTIEHHLSRVLSRAGSVQGRIATRTQVQVPLGYPQHRLWENRFRNWWVQAFEAIRARAGERESVMFCTELGPRPYAWTDAYEHEVSDRWAEALTLREWATSAFAASERMPEPDSHSPRAPQEVSP